MFRKVSFRPLSCGLSMLGDKLRVCVSVIEVLVRMTVRLQWLRLPTSVVRLPLILLVPCVNDGLVAQIVSVVWQLVLVRLAWLWAYVSSVWVRSILVRFFAFLW